MSTMRSPNEMVAKAKRQMLGGQEPKCWTDWARVMNFIALNVHKDVAENACLVMRTLYSMPLTDREVTEIVHFQNSQR